MMSSIDTPVVKKIIHDSLFSPVSEFCARPGKNLRARLIHIGYQLSYDDEKAVSLPDQSLIKNAESIIEGIHSGSLIVDDIQDQSQERRNAPTLHVLHGIPLALNAGNWLYFHALSQIKSLNLDLHIERKLTHELVMLMMKAHTGQALDLGSKMKLLPQNEVHATCMASMELKTGTLLHMALLIGSSISGKDSDSPLIADLGNKLGTLLQMMDDIGNTFGTSSKKFEDLLNQRPTWIWAVASKLPSDEYKKFLEAVANPEAFSSWDNQHNFKSFVLSETEQYKKEVIAFIRHEWFRTHPQSVTEILNMISLLEKAYA